MSQVINRLYFPKKVERKEAIATFKTIQQGLNEFVEEYDEYMDRKWNVYEIITIMYGIHNNYTPDAICAAIHNLTQGQKNTLSTFQDINLKVLGILKEVY